MSLIIDRRLNAKNKSTVNRQRFLRRYRGLVKEAVREAVDQRSITDINSGTSISIPKKDLSEPIFQHGAGGQQHRVFSGNKEFATGDQIQRPLSGGKGKGRGKGKASNSGAGVDDFVFQINRDEFLQYLFDHLALPNLVRKEFMDTSEFRLKQAGFTSVGSPDRLNVVRSLRAAHARRIALSGKDRREIRVLKRELREMEVGADDVDQQQAGALRERIKILNKKLKRLPFIDDFDLKFNNLTKVPQPSSKAVMFCIMDVSGSMTREIKDMAKRFFLLLYLFLQHNYEAVEVAFIRHHSEARECNENDFFYARETGGTVVSTALNLADTIIRQRYSPNAWNIYIAQASDGDNWEADSNKCRDIITGRLLPLIQYYSYVEITDRHHQNLWHEYKTIEQDYAGRFAMQQIRHHGDIYPVFRRLFEKKEVHHA